MKKLIPKWGKRRFWRRTEAVLTVTGKWEADDHNGCVVEKELSCVRRYNRREGDGGSKVIMDLYGDGPTISFLLETKESPTQAIYLWSFRVSGVTILNMIWTWHEDKQVWVEISDLPTCLFRGSCSDWYMGSLVNPFIFLIF